MQAIIDEHETWAINGLHEFLKRKIMHQSDPRRRLVDDAFVTIQDISIEKQINFLGSFVSAGTRRWPYFAAIAIHSDVWEIDFSYAEDDIRFVKCLSKYLQDFPRLAYLNVSIDDPKLRSFYSLIGKLLKVPEYGDFWASFGPVEQKAQPALDKEEESHLKDEFRERIKLELKQELREDIRNEIKAALKVSIEEELKAVFNGDVEASQDEEPGPTVAHEMEQSTSEEDSSSSSEDSANGLSMDEPRNESKGVQTETIEELPGDLVSVEKQKINVKITKNEMDDHKDELAVESTNDSNQAAKQEMHLEIQKEGKEEESKAEIREPIETKVDEVKLTVPREMEQRDESREEVSNSLQKESAYGFSMDDVRNETKRIVTEANEELKGDLVSIVELKIKAKIAKSVKNELKDELAEEVANDLMDFKRDMKKKQSKMMDTLREQLHEDIKDEIVQMIQQDLKKCLQDLRRTKPN